MLQIWPFFVCMAALLCLASTPALAWADTPPSPVSKRLVSLDGLRGLLAFAVVFHHVAIYSRFAVTGVWETPGGHFYAVLGPAAVSLFFMITGYLFWGRLLREQGKLRWTDFYLGRLFRISPVYLFAVGTMLLLVMARTHFTFVASPGALTKQLIRWLALGILDPPLAFNGDASAYLLVAGVTWTIRFEWLFYFSLPFLAVAARFQRLDLGLLATVYLVCVWVSHTHKTPAWNHPYEKLACLFVMGMLTASLQTRGVRLLIRDDWASAITLALLCAAFIPHNPYSYLTGLLLGGAFYLIASGCTIWGLLTMRAARRLGDISYGIYLLQGLALAAIFQPGILRGFVLRSPLNFWVSALIASVLLIFLATFVQCYG